MRHGSENKKLGRTATPPGDVRQHGGLADQARANVTTLPKAKRGARPVFERLVTLAKKGDPGACAAWFSRACVTRPKPRSSSKRSRPAKARAGGYTRVPKAGFRHGDNAPLAVIELVDRDERLAKTAARARKRRTPKTDSTCHKRQ
ncbi:MAG: L17 family ribosomal protein [Hyphomonadaceae bacterium]